MKNIRHLPPQKGCNALSVRELRERVSNRYNRKLLIFHPYLAPYRVDLYNHLASDFDLKVALFGSMKERNTLGFNLDLVNQRAQFDYDYYDKGLYLGRHLLSTIYLSLIKHFRPDILITHELGINTLAAICLKRFFGYRIFTTIDDSPEMAFSVKGRRERLRRYVMRRVDGVITVNPQVTNLFKERYGGDKFKSIFFPIIQDDLLLAERIRKSRDHALGLIKHYHLEDKRIVLFVGRLEKIKNPVWLAERFVEMDIDDTVLVFVGDGSEKAKLKQIAEAAGMGRQIIITGALSGSDLYAWYYLAYIFVLPSSFEPFGAVVNEALVAGCRVMVSDKVGARCLVNDANGCIFPLGDAEYFKNNLIMELQGTSGMKKHVSLMPKTFEEYYNELINSIDNEEM